MAVFLIMGKFTQQGIAHLKQTTQRSDRFREIAAKFNVRVRDIFWLLGEYDVVNIVEAEDEQAVAALMFELGTWGNVTTTTFRAYTKEEMLRIFEKMDAAAGK